MIDDRWMPPRSQMRSPQSPANVRRDHLSDRERLLALEMTDSHHDELQRQTAHRLEMGDLRMDHIENRLTRQDQREAAREARAEEKATARKARNEAIQMTVWVMALVTGALAIWNFANPRPPPSPSEVIAPARR